MGKTLSIFRDGVAPDPAAPQGGKYFNNGNVQNKVTFGTDRIKFQQQPDGTSTAMASSADMQDPILEQGGVKDQVLANVQKNYARMSQDGANVLGIDPNKRNEKIPVTLSSKFQDGSGYFPSERRAEIDTVHSGAEGLGRDSLRYNGYADKFITAPADQAGQSLAHELAHHHTTAAEGIDYQRARDSRQRLDLEDKGSTYASDRASEYKAMATSGLNTLRASTGRTITDPQDFHQAWSEIEANPAVLDQMPAEGARIFRSILQMKREGNLQGAQSMLNALARDSQLLAQNPSQQGMGEKLASSDRLRTILDAVLTHNVGSAVMGGAVGATAGAFMPAAGDSPKDKGQPSRWKQIVAGATIGAGTGYGLSRIAPQASSQANHFLADNLLLKPLGRVVTNLSTPESYDHKVSEVVGNLKKSPWQSLKAVFSDRPIWLSESTPQNSNAVLRDAPFRQMYGLPSRGIGPVYPRNQNGTYGVNDVVEEDLKSGLTRALSPIQNASSDAITINPPEEPDGKILLKNNLLGNVLMTPIIRGKAYSFKDRWDISLDKDDKLNSASNILRHVISKINHPVTFEGAVALPEKESPLDATSTPMNLHTPPAPTAPSMMGDKMVSL